jgi:hypothetical protein
MEINTETAYTAALGSLRVAMLKLTPGKRTYEEIVATREQVFARYRPIFCLDHIPTLTKDEYTSFLYFENNRHWSGLYRKGLQAAANMETLRNALLLLLDEGKPLQTRFTSAIDQVNGLGKGTATGILTVALPEVYGVWNNTSESAMRQIEIWPEFEKGDSIGAKYAKVNAVLTRLRTDLGTDFWTLDAVWWSILDPDGTANEQIDTVSTTSEVSPEATSSFGLERQLENFLLENWDHTELGKEWAIYGTKDEPEAGNQFPTDVGRIDILAVHKTQNKMLVIELKRDQSTDATVGQVLRYIGWVEKHLAQPNQKTVQGLIIAHEQDKTALYALSTLNHVKFMTYEIKFSLSSPQLQE